MKYTGWGIAHQRTTMCPRLQGGRSGQAWLAWMMSRGQKAPAGLDSSGTGPVPALSHTQR